MSDAIRIIRPLLGLLGGLAFTAAAFASPQAQFTKAQFGALVNEAYGEIWKRNGGANAADYGAGGKHAMQEFAWQGASGAFRINVNMACEFPDSRNSASFNYNKVMSFSIPAVFVNYGDRMQYQFWTQQVSALYAPYVEKELAKRQKEMQGEFEGGELTISRKDTGQYSIDAARAYGTGVKPAELRAQMVELISNSGFALCDIVTHSWLANEKVWDDHKGPITGPVSKELFVALNPLLRKDNYETEGTAPHGTWRMRGDGWGETYENHGDRMDLSMGMNVPKGLSTEKSQALYAALQAIGPAKGAARLDVYMADGYIWLTSVYPYQGMTGKQVMNTCQEFSDDWAEELYDKARKAVKKAL